ncbi:MAG: prealbumin-like fold domain-containing protein [Subdoligranulum sp.]
MYNKANALVDTVESDSRGLAVSKPLPLGRYTVKEISSPQFYSVSDEEVTVYLEHEGQIVQVEYLNESVYTNVSISKSGYTQVVPGPGDPLYLQGYREQLHSPAGQLLLA